MLMLLSSHTHLIIYFISITGLLQLSLRSAALLTFTSYIPLFLSSDDKGLSAGTGLLYDELISPRSIDTAD
jgi:hypothetical protein